MFGGPRLGHPQLLGQLGHRPLTRPQQHQDLPALLLGDRPHDEVHPLQRRDARSGEDVVAVAVAAKRAGVRKRRMQHVRLLRGRAGRGVFETEVDTNLLESRESRAQRLSRGSASAPPVATLLTRGLRT